MRAALCGWSLFLAACAGCGGGGNGGEAGQGGGGGADGQGDADSSDAADAGAETRVDMAVDAPADPPGDAMPDVVDAPAGDVPPCQDWIRRKPASGLAPKARQGFGMAYDPDRKVVVVFGGVDASEAAFSDIWEWDGKDWIERTPSPRPMAWPRNRQFPGLAYDAGRKKLVVHGGEFDTKPLDDWWEWDGKAMTMTERLATPAPGSWPPPRSKHGFVYDAKRARLLAFGGYGADGKYLGDLWELDGTAGSAANRTPGTLPAAWPSARIVNGGLSYDAASGRAYLFGGQAGVIAPLDDLRAWDGAAGAWTDLTPTPRPAIWPGKRACHATAWDGKRGRLMLFEGCSPSFLRDLWEWSPVTGAWTDRTPPTFPDGWPKAQAFPGIAFDAAQAVLVAFGGGASSADVPFSDDTFEYSCAD